MSVASWASGGVGLLLAGLYGVVVNSYNDRENALTFFFPVWWTVLMVAGVLVLGALGLAFKIASDRPAPRPVPTPSKLSGGGLRVVVPGRTQRGLLSAMLNMRDRSHRVTWQTNGAHLGDLYPAKRGPGFEVHHVELGHVGSAPNVQEGLAILESAETQPR